MTYGIWARKKGRTKIGAAIQHRADQTVAHEGSHQEARLREIEHLQQHLLEQVFEFEETVDA